MPVVPRRDVKTAADLLQFLTDAAKKVNLDEVRISLEIANGRAICDQVEIDRDTDLYLILDGI